MDNDNQFILSADDLGGLIMKWWVIQWHGMTYKVYTSSYTEALGYVIMRGKQKAH